MRRIGFSLALLGALAMPIILTGCGASPQPANNSAGHSDHDGHDHGEHEGHDHDGDGHADHEAKDHK